MGCYDHMGELLVAAVTFAGALYSSHCKLDKNIKSNNGDVAHHTEEVKKLASLVRELIKKD